MLSTWIVHDFLKQLQRAGLTSTQLFHNYTAVIRSVLEYCAPVWHYALTKSHTLQLEAIQKRAIQIVLNFSLVMPYSSMLFAADLNSLASRRKDISRKFFHNITQSTSCLHHLLPDPKLSSHNSRRRSYDTVHFSSTHWATIRIEYTTQRLFTFDSDLLHYSLYFYCILFALFIVFLANVNYITFAICYRNSVCLSVCLSVVCL